MKLPALISALVVSTVVSGFSLTNDDILPGALAGKTLTFTITSGTAPLATTGSWSGTFLSAPTNGFSIANITGNTVSIDTTAVYDGSLAQVQQHIYVIAPMLRSGARVNAELTLWVSGGKGEYWLLLKGGINDPEVSQLGEFTVGAASPKLPEIVIQQPKGSDLTDNKSKKSFGTVKVGQTGAAKTFIVKNTGKAKLTGLAVSKSGTNRGEFIASAPGSTSLAPGKSTSFTVRFKPKSAATRNAVIKLSSNDSDENPFEIKVTGQGAVK